MSHIPVSAPKSRLFQLWRTENIRNHAHEALLRLRRAWEARQLRLLNFILHVPYDSPVSERSKRQASRSPQWQVVGKDSGTFILSGEAQPLGPRDSRTG